MTSMANQASIINGNFKWIQSKNNSWNNPDEIQQVRETVGVAYYRGHKKLII